MPTMTGPQAGHPASLQPAPLDLSSAGPAFCLLLIGAATALFLLLAYLGIYPMIFADEYTYSRTARLLPLSEASIPSYLYLLITRLTNVCGEGFLTCARVLNVALFVGAIPFIYKTARLVCGRPAAVAVAAVAVVSPVNSYTAFFMPEAAYFLVFWMFAFVLLRQRETSSLASWALCGAAFGVLALVKPHALFLVPALLLHAPFVCRKAGLRAILQACAALLLTGAAVKFGISYLAAGQNGLTLFGPAYGAIAASSGGALGQLWLAAENLRGHVMAIILLCALPVAVLGILIAHAGNDADTQPRNIAVFTLLVFGSLVGVTVLFTLSVADTSPYESIARLHMRYYNFAFPLFLILLAAQTQSAFGATPRALRVFLAAAIGAVVLSAAVSNFNSFAPSFIDSPELRGITASRMMMWLAVAASLICLLLWIVRPRFAAGLVLFVVLPACAVTESYHVSRDIRQRLAPDAYDNAGMFARRFLSVAERDKLVVLGPDQAGQLRTLFHIDTRHSSWDVWSKLRDVPLQLGGHLRSALIIGDAPPIPDTFAVVRMPGFLLARQIADVALDFAQPLPLGIIESIEGLSAPKPSGAEASGDSVVLKFGAGLPSAFKLHLTARARGGRAPSRFAARVGDDNRDFELGAAEETRVLEFRNPARSPVITFHGQNLVLKSLRIE